MATKNNDLFPIIDIRLELPNRGGFNEMVHNFTDIAEGICDRPSNIVFYLDNLSRLKIIDVPENQRIKSDDAYTKLLENSDIKKLLDSKLPEGYSFDVIKKQFEFTEFGKKFVNNCVIDK